ncbi:MAG: protein kinase domain-containing protein [Acidobacteriota bacterium]
MDGVPSQLGDFRIEAVLGSGGSGIVYDAVWGPRRVALKVLHASLVATDKERAQFLGEAQRLQQITHPSVVKVFAVGELPDGRPYLAMERLEGEPLARVIARGPVSLAHAVQLWSELCAAVAALHACGLVHRDLKPENVFVVGGKHAVLLDFGIAKDLAAPASTTTQDGQVRGTPAYMAPERFFGQPAGIATDVYELALVLYAMLAGRLPWDDVADPEARLAPRSLCELAPVPPALDVEIRRALSTRAPNRPASAEALLAVVRDTASAMASPDSPAVTAPMRAARDGAPTGAPPAEQPTPLAWAPTVAAQTAKRGGNKRWIGAAAVVVAIAGAGGLIWKTRGSRSNASASTSTSTKQIETPKPDPNDPWGDHPAAVEEVKALPLVEPKLTVETYRAEAAAAIARLPADTHFVLTAQIGELRAQSQIDDMLQKAGKQPQVALLAATLPPCLKAMVTDAEWLAFGAPSLHTTETGTLVLRGRWRRDAVESCLGDTVKPHVAHDGAKLYRVADDFWLDFIDAHTAFVTRHADYDAERVHELVKHGAGPVAHARELVAHLPADRSLAFVLDGSGKEQVIADTLGLPDTSDLAGWVRVEAAGVALDVTADPHDGKAAQAAVDRLRPQLDGVFGTANKDAVGKLEVVRDRTVVHVRGTMTTLMLGLISSAI